MRASSTVARSEPRPQSSRPGSNRRRSDGRRDLSGGRRASAESPPARAGSAARTRPLPTRRPIRAAPPAATGRTHWRGLPLAVTGLAVRRQRRGILDADGAIPGNVAGRGRDRKLTRARQPAHQSRRAAPCPHAPTGGCDGAGADCQRSPTCIARPGSAAADSRYAPPTGQPWSNGAPGHRPARRRQRCRALRRRGGIG